MTELVYQDTESVERTIRWLIRTWPAAVNSASELILTADPAKWIDDSTRGSPTLVDVGSFLPAIRSSIAFSDRRAGDLVEMFARAGWPRNYLFQDYAPSSKSSRRVDLAIVIPPHRWLLAVELRASLPPATLERRLRELAGIWFDSETGIVPEQECLTDGRIFALQTGGGSPAGWQTVILDEVPRPERFDIQPELPSVPVTNFVALESLRQLPDLIRDRRIDAIVLDQTLPVGRTSQASSTPSSSGPVPNGLDIGEEAVALALQSGVLVVSAIYPSATMSSVAKKEFRALLSGQTRLGAVVELPRGLYRDNSNPAAWLCCAATPYVTYFGKLGKIPSLTEFLSTTWHSELATWFAGGPPPTQGFVARLEKDAAWTASAQHPGHRLQIDRLSRLGAQVPISEVCQVFTGSAGSGVAGGDVALIKGACLIDGRVDLSNAERIAPTVPIGDRNWAQPGDVLLSRAFHGRSNIAVVVGDEPAIISSNVICLRLISDKITPQALREFLSSSAGEALLQHTIGGTFIPHISLVALRSSSVPSLEPDVLAGLDEARRLEKELRESASDLEARRHQLFDADNLQQFRQHLDELKRVSRVMRASVLSADRIDYLISNYYPYPLAYGYRMLSSVGDPSQRYAVACQVAEDMLAYVASVSMALLDAPDRPRADLGLNATLRGGISPGHWRDFGRRCSAVISEYEGNPLAIALSALDIGSNESQFGSAAGFLIEQINRYKHRRPHTIEEISDTTETIVEKVQFCFQQLNFLTDYPIHLVDRCDQLRNGRFRADCQQYLGDHPGHARERIELHSAKVAGDLYVEVRTFEWISLFPFLSVVSCPTCHNRETYRLGRQRSQGIELSSFERGHVVTSSESLGGLESWLGGAPGG